MSRITTHILDTSIGKPATGVAVTLYHKRGEVWHALAAGTTNNDGRLANLLADDITIESGIYKLLFETKTYFNLQNIPSFYPHVTIEFEVKGNEHYHVPLLLNPFGYSTYRGS